MDVILQYDVLHRHYELYILRGNSDTTEILSLEGEVKEVVRDGDRPQKSSAILSAPYAKQLLPALVKALNEAGFKADGPEPAGALAATRNHLAHATSILDRVLGIVERRDNG